MDIAQKSIIDENCRLINIGCKPASLFTISEFDENEVIKSIKKNSLNYAVQYLGSHAVNVWIFKNPTLRLIIENLKYPMMNPADHFLLGSILGHSIDSTLEYIKNRPYWPRTSSDAIAEDFYQHTPPLYPPPFFQF